MMVSKSLQSDVEFKIQDGLNRAREYFGREFEFPSISYNLSGKTAGTATYQKNHIRLNATLLKENAEDFIARTVPHELAHLITWQVYWNDWSFNNGRRIQHHGSHWKQVCTIIGMEDVTRCHSYDVSNSGRKSEQFVWGCDVCGDLMSVSRVKHNKMLGGHYHHKCGRGRRGNISFVVNAGLNTKQGAVAQVREGLSQGQEVKPVETKVKTRKTPPKTRQGRSGKSGGTSNMGRARTFVRKTPGLSSEAIRAWCQASLGVSAHGARAIYSKLKKEGLVS